jgi:hypothetical protein
VQEVDELRGRYRGLDEIALVLAARGRPLDPVSVKAALLQVINGIERSFRSHAKDVDDPFEIAYSATSALTRAWRNDRGSRRGTGSVLPRPLLEIGGRLLIGDPVASHQLREFLGGGSLAPLLSALDLSVEPLADHLAAHAARFSFPAIRATVEQTNPDAVIAALLTASGTIRAFPLLQAVVPTETAYDVTVIGMSIGFLTAGARTN